MFAASDVFGVKQTLNASQIFVPVKPESRDDKHRKPDKRRSN
jgi:hypothetical protein